MKKSPLIVWLLCVCLLLTSCTASDPHNLFETPESSTALSNTEITQPDSNETESTPSDAEEIILYTGTYPYGNMQKNQPSGNFVLLGNEVMFYHHVDGQFLLYRYDLITGEVLLYCEDATCKHEVCAASILIGNLEIYQGKLYGLKVSELEDKPGALWQPVVFNGGTAEIITTADIGGFFHHEDKMYAKTADSSLIVLEVGRSKPQMVIEEYLGYGSVIFGNYLYSKTDNQNMIRIDLTTEILKEEIIVPNGKGMTDGQHIYFVDNKTCQLYRCDMDGSNIELLVEQPVLLASINFDEEYFYYRLYTDRKLNGTADSCDIYRFPKDDPTQIEKIVTLPVSAYQVFTVPGTGKIFVTTHAPQGESRPLYVMNTDGSDPKVLEIPEY